MSQQNVPTEKIEKAISQHMKHDCTQGDILDQINGKLDQIIERLAKGDTAIALLEHRVNSLEKVVYGLCGVILLAVVGGLVALVVRTGP
jgi:hypothetical protein